MLGLRGRRQAGVRFLAAVALLVVAPLITPAASATPTAPRPTSSQRSPSTPDPHPTRGGIGPDGLAVGGPRLLERGVVRPTGSLPLPKGLTARAWVLVDLDRATVLAARDPHGRYPPASILKVLSSLVLLPRLPGRRLVTASANAVDAEGSAVGLVPGGRYSVDTLFKSLLLQSGNDAAAVLAEAGGGITPTVARMNAEARRLGAYDTVAETPSGLDGWKQLTSAYDMALVLRAAAGNPRFLAYDRALTARLPAQRVGAKRWGAVPLYNQAENFLTGVPGALMAKTGFTDAAGHTYLCAGRRGGRRLGVVFLRARRAPTDQWQQAASLLRWGFARPASSTGVGVLAGPVAAGGPASPTSGSPVPPSTASAGSTSASPPAGSSSLPAGSSDADRFPAGSSDADRTMALSSDADRTVAARSPGPAWPAALSGGGGLLVLLVGLAAIRGVKRRRRLPRGHP